MSDFQSFPKISRYFRDIVITEKLDGTNGQVYIKVLTPGDDRKTLLARWSNPDTTVGGELGLYAGSRNRILSVKSDNFGFARWVEEHAPELSDLGVGRHFGEWWGNGINRGYGLQPGDKRFSLFNSTRWADPEERPLCCDVVPMLYSGPIVMPDGELAVRHVMRRITFAGSQAAPGFKNPEGIVVYHTHGNFLQKISCDPEEDAGGKDRAA